MARERGDIDGDLALRIAVIGIDADDLELPVAARRGDLDGIADSHLQPTGQLFADEAGIARRRQSSPRWMQIVTA